jgi:hypothetical protein
MNDANSLNTLGLPDNPTTKQAEQALYEAAEVIHERLRNEVIQRVGQLVLEEMEVAANNLREDSDDEPSTVNIFEAVRDDLVDEIRIDHPALRQLYPWAASGCLFAKVWEQYVRLYPEQEPWPDDTEAARWRSLEG